jgi:hypothetical protein
MSQPQRSDFFRYGRDFEPPVRDKETAKWTVAEFVERPANRQQQSDKE